MITADTIRQALQCGEPGCPCGRPGGHVHCPGHEDKTPSLSVTNGGGKILVKCFGDCEQNRVIDTLKARNLWPSRNGDGARGLTLADLASAKRLPIESLKKWGVSNFNYKERPAVHIPYRDIEGKVTSRYRLDLTQEPRLLWKKGSKTLLYGLWHLPVIRKLGWVLLVEGESDCWTCWLNNIPALGIPGKTNWKPDWAVHLTNLKVYLWQEPDAPELPGKVARSIPGLLVIKAPEGFKDISEAHLQGLDVAPLIDELRAQARPPQADPSPGGPADAVEGLPQIVITKRFLHDKATEAIKALETANQPPFLFRRSGSLARISLDEKDHPRIETITDIQLRGILARRAYFLKETEKGLVATAPPMDLVKDILALGEWDLSGP